MKPTSSFVGRALTTAKLSSRLGQGALKKLINSPPTDPEKAVALAISLAREFDEMKGLIMKFGQMASYLNPNLPPEAKKVLAQLQSQSSSMSFEDVQQIINSELGKAVDDQFIDFEPQAFAAASIGQVHKAVITDPSRPSQTREVAVKVQYPDIDRLLDTDLKLVGSLFTMMMATSKTSGKALAAELRRQLLEECDYHKEAKYQTAIRNLCLAQYPDKHTALEYVPEVIASHSAQRVITSEFISALDFNHFVANADQDARNRASALLFTHAFRSIFKHCYFNGDPQPGNYLLHNDGRVVFLDFGCVKQFDESFIERWKAMAKSVIEQDKKAHITAIKELGLVGSKRFDMDFQWEMINHIYKPYRSKETFRYGDPSYNQKTNELMLWQNKNKFYAKIPPDFLFVNRLQWGLASVLASLQGECIYSEIFQELLYGDLDPLRAHL